MFNIRRVTGRHTNRLLVWLIGGALFLWLGGCPIDRNAIITETTRAALQASLDSFIATLARQLALS